MNNELQATPKSPAPETRTLNKVNDSSLNNIKVLNKIDAGKFMIFLAKSQTSEKKFALKAYPYQKDGVCSLYENEKKFMSYKHPNVIDIMEAHDDCYLPINGMRQRSSYILMEFAPYKDFHDFIMDKGITLDDKLARTYFHQLIEGLEYLHSRGVYHLDIKLENLLVGDDFQLKIADFDISHIKGQGSISSRGTKCYRAPELARGACSNPASADIYSAAIILFIFKSNGYIPYTEEKHPSGIDLYPLMKHEDPKFWEHHSRFQKKTPDFFEEDFKELFTSMVKTEASKRCTIESIKKSNWYNGPVYSSEELTGIMASKYILKL